MCRFMVKVYIIKYTMNDYLHIQLLDNKTDIQKLKSLYAFGKKGWLYNHFWVLIDP